jgi:hypothetical protein
MVPEAALTYDARAENTPREYKIAYRQLLSPSTTIRARAVRVMALSV